MSDVMISASGLREHEPVEDDWPNPSIEMERRRGKSPSRRSDALPFASPDERTKPKCATNREDAHSPTRPSLLLTIDVHINRPRILIAVDLDADAGSFDINNPFLAFASGHANRHHCDACAQREVPKEPIEWMMHSVASEKCMV